MMNVLFVCTGNTCRSPMAEALLKSKSKRLNKRINVKSRGLYAIDNDLPMIVVNHVGCEIGGLKNMVKYFNDKLPNLNVEYLDEGFKISYFK